MADLFFLPKVSGLPGAKLYFYQTGTSTPQAVYTDADLSVAHDQPIEADGAGVFEPIYLDPTLPHYRVTYTTSADVLIYTWDDYPSNQNVQQSMRLESTAPELWLYDTDGTVNARKVRIRVNGQIFEISLSNDAENSFTEFFSYNPSNSSVELLGLVPLNGVAARTLNGSTLNTSTTLANDPDLAITLEGSSVYAIDGQIEFYAATGQGAMGAKFGLAYSGAGIHSGTRALVNQYANGSGSVVLSAFSNASPLAIATLDNSQNEQLITFSLSVRTSSAVTVTLQRAQNSSNGSNLSILANSWIRAQRIASNSA